MKVIEEFVQNFHTMPFEDRVEEILARWDLQWDSGPARLHVHPSIGLDELGRAELPDGVVVYMDEHMDPWDLRLTDGPAEPMPVGAERRMLTVVSTPSESECVSGMHRWIRSATDDSFRCPCGNRITVEEVLRGEGRGRWR